MSDGSGFAVELQPGMEVSSGKEGESARVREVFEGFYVMEAKGNVFCLPREADYFLVNSG